MLETNTIHLGDCLSVMDKIDDKSIDMVLCDLPYGTTQCSWDTIISFESLWSHYSRICKDSAAIVLFGAEPFSSKLRLSNIDLFKYDWVWDKIKGTGFLNAKKQPMRIHEMVSVFYKSQCTYNAQKTTGHKLKQSFRRKHLQTDVYGQMNEDYIYSSTERYPTSIQCFSTDTQNSSLHPTQKPVSICEYLINTYTKKGDLILDNCIGSGTTAIAAFNTNRNFIGIEKDVFYPYKAIDRYKNHTLQQRLF